MGSLLQYKFKEWAYPFTVKVDEFKAWAPLLQYKLMILRRGLTFKGKVDEFKAWAYSLAV